MFLRPLDPQWTIAVTASIAALLLGGVGLLLIELAEVSGLHTDLSQHPENDVRYTARLFETDRGWKFEVEGPAAGRVLVVDRLERSFEIELDASGRAYGTTVDHGELPPAIESRAPPAVLKTPTPPPTAVPVVLRPQPPEAPTQLPISHRPRVTPRPTKPASQENTTPPPTPTPTPKATLPPSLPGTAALAADQVPPILHLVTDAGPNIAITFDGGASSNRTAELLDLLQDLDIKATLFLTGSFIRAQPALVRRAVLSGHEVGNHTDSHPHLTSYATDGNHRTLPGITRSSFLAELERTEQAFRRATGRSMAPLWRAPYGEENARLRGWALQAGYLHVRWSSLEGRSLDTMDWIEDEHSPYFRDSRRIMDRLLRFPQLRGGIILMHLATDREEPPWLELPAFAAALRERSIEPVKVTTLLEESRIWRGWLERAARRHAEIWDEGPEHP